MNESTEAILARMSTQIESMSKEMTAIRERFDEQASHHATELDSIWVRIDQVRTENTATQNSLIELKGMLRGGAMVLAFFQAVVFSAFFWLFSTVSTQGTSITQLQGYDQQLTLLVKQLQTQKE